MRVLYCYTAPNSSDHDGLVKVGDTSTSVALGADAAAKDALAREAALARIRQQVGAGGMATNLEWFLIVPWFQMRDYRVHAQLRAVGIERVFPGGTKAREWYRTTPEHAREVAEAAIGGYAPETGPGNYLLRDEQSVFVENALDAWVAGAEKRLWDAKMRFGKTLTALEFIAQARQADLEDRAGGRRMAKVLILTHRPVVNGNWYEEFTKVMARGAYAGQEWQYASKELSVTSKTFAEINQAKPFIYFASLQDLRGRDGSNDDSSAFKASNQVVFDTDWDMVLIDEAHEGNRTTLAQEVHAALRRGFTLYLSGTPYKYLADSDFLPEEMDTWDYGMEQERKFSWVDTHPGEDNPYADLPQMWIYALDMAETLQSKYHVDGGEVAFDFREMFKAVGQGSRARFERETEVRDFLTSLASNDTYPLPTGGEIAMPFARDGAAHRHTLWMLPSVAICHAMKAALQAHPDFVGYKVVNVAGSGDAEAQNANRTVKKAIASNDRTITLTVGRMTTGVTIPEWTAILMLSNLSAAESYMQAIFRTQTPYAAADGTQKTECFVYDFAPDRVLQVLSNVAGAVNKAGHNQTEQTNERLNTLLNYLPVLSRVDAKDFRRMDAGEVTRAIKRIYRERVVEAGFDSDLLFVKDLSNLPEAVRDAIETVRVVSGSNLPDTRSKVRDTTVAISENGLDQKEFDRLQTEIRELERIPKTERTPEEREALATLKAEAEARTNMRNILRTIGVRIPLLVLGLMSESPERVQALKEQFTLTQFVGLIDDESWTEFFQNITKETVLNLKDVFDADILQVAVRGWVEDIEAALELRETGRYQEYGAAVATLMGKVRNPNKETVFTPWDAVRVVYEAAGFPGTPASPTRSRYAWTAREKLPTFYDINIKSGLFSLYAALKLTQANPSQRWDAICDEAIYGNARTLAGKWIACTLLGKPRDWPNITVIDVRAELGAEDLSGLPGDQKQAFLIHFLTAPLRAATLLGSAGRTRLTADIRDMDERRSARDKAQGTAPGIPLEDCRFDHVISNPPYQVLDENNETKAHPIWPDFLQLASRVGRRVAVINPGRWLKGGVGTGLHPIRDWLLANPHLDVVYTLPNEDVFPTATIKGDLTIEVIDNDREFDAKMCAWTKADGWGKPHRLKVSEQVDIPLSDIDFDIVSRIRAEFQDYIEKTLWQGGKANLTRRATSGRAGKSAQDRFGIRPMRMVWDTDYFITEAEKDSSVDYLKVRFLGEGKRVEARFLPKTELQDTDNNRERVPVWKVAISKTEAQMLYRNPGPPLPPDTLCTETWLCRIVDSEKQVKNFQSYLRTYFYRYLVSLRRATQDAFPHVHRFVPDLERVKNPRTGRVGYNSSWTDDDIALLLADVLTEDDWRHIKRTAIAADGGRGDYEAGWKFPDGSIHASLTSVTLDPGPTHGEQ